MPTHFSRRDIHCTFKSFFFFCGLNVVAYFTALGSLEYFDNCNSSMKLVIPSFNYFSLNRFGVTLKKTRLVFSLLPFDTMLNIFGILLDNR